MKITRRTLLCFAALILLAFRAAALERTNITFPIFQFPADKIPTIDGQTNDWSIIPASYIIGTDQLVDDNGKFPAQIGRASCRERV